ncbi:MAG: condensation domain-containing protein, partial [Pyrinomonadaceae bacterium]
ELGEVEAALLRHEGVEAAAVVVRGGAGGEGQMVGYVVVRGGEEVRSEELRGHLRETLPEYMVPGMFVQVEQMPLTANGKIDRLMLLASGTQRPELIRDFEPPQNHAEEVLARIWSSLLGFERIGRHDNFFDLGGDSILSIQIVARANQEGLKLTPQHLFQHQTIAELVAVAGVASELDDDEAAGSVPLMPGQTRLFERNAGSLQRLVNIASFEVRQPLTPELLTRAFEHLLVRHDALRLRFVNEGGGWRQFRQAQVEASPVAFVNLSALPEPEQESALEALASRMRGELNPAHAPLLAATLVELGAGSPKRLLIATHRLVADETSLRILMRDLQIACEQLVANSPVDLGVRPPGFSRWAERQTSADESARELDYRLEMARAAESAQQPLNTDDDMDNSTAVSGSARTFELSLSPDETRAVLRRIPAESKVSADELLLTALAQTLAPRTDKRALFVELEASARQWTTDGLDLSGAVGQFTSVFPVRLSLDGARTPADELKTIKEQLRCVPGFGASSHLRSDEPAAERLRALPAGHVHYRCLDDAVETRPASEWFKPTALPVGTSDEPEGASTSALELRPRVEGERLILNWASGGEFAPEATEQLARHYLATLQAQIKQCLSAGAAGFTPSDFPTAGLSQQELDDLLAEIEE